MYRYSDPMFLYRTQNAIFKYNKLKIVYAVLQLMYHRQKSPWQSQTDRLSTVQKSEGLQDGFPFNTVQQMC
jgi:hypothetical protein